MPRANRIIRNGFVWHITHRCHQRRFLLKFGLDKRRWRYWLFQAKRRYGVQILDFIVTSNHVHLLVMDEGRGEIARSIQLVAGRTAQEYNRRKRRKGAFWEDRYHATAVETGMHLARCLSYIDLNMVRAGVVCHPGEWKHGGYREIQNPPARKRVINTELLCSLLGLHTLTEVQTAQNEWIERELINPVRQSVWTESVAVGGYRFLAQVEETLGVTAKKHRSIESVGRLTCLREEWRAYVSFSGPKTAN